MCQVRNHLITGCLVLALLACLACASSAAYRDGEVVVKYKPGVETAAMAAVSARVGDVIQSIEGIRTHRLRLPRGVSVEQAIARLRQDPNVEYAGPNHIVHICLMPDDDIFVNGYLGVFMEWGLYDPSDPDAGIDAPDAMDITTGSSNVTIAIVDTGILSSHEDLYAKVVPGYNSIQGADPTNTEDDHYHGTFTAGIAGAMTNNGIGIAGTSRGAMPMPIKALDSAGSGTEADAASGIAWAADHGAQVINMSFGGYDDVPVEQAAIEYAWGKGCVLVAASGNDDSNDPFYPAYYPQVLAVGATDEDMQRCTADDWGAGGSNYGSYLGCVAPGNDIVSTTTMNDPMTFDGLYSVNDGTSVAAPFVSESRPSSSASIRIGPTPRSSIRLKRPARTWETPAGTSITVGGS